MSKSEFKIDFEVIVDKIVTHLVEHRSIEIRNFSKVKDDILVGLIKLLDSIFKVRPFLKEKFGVGSKKNLVEIIFS